MTTILASRHVSLATAERSKQWHHDLPRVPLKRRAGGRCATLVCTLEQFAARLGNPHCAAPSDQWRNYEGHDLIDGAGKVSAVWYFDTPRGLVRVSDYWWNAANELSILACDVRAVIWFRRWCREHGFKFLPTCRPDPRDLA
jgi:hypothetical protein